MISSNELLRVIHHSLINVSLDVLNKDSEMSWLYTAKHHILLPLLNPGDWTPREDYYLSVLWGGGGGLSPP